MKAIHTVMSPLYDLTMGPEVRAFTGLLFTGLDMRFVAATL